MKKLLPILAVAALCLPLVFLAAEENKPADMTLVKAKDVRWAAIEGAPTGVVNSVLAGDPSKEGSVMFLKFPAGMVAEPHYHSANETFIKW